MNISPYFIASTALDYDVYEYIVTAIAAKSIGYDEFYMRLESHISERE